MSNSPTTPYKWFDMEKDLFESLSPEEKALVKCEVLPNNFVRCWYPPINFIHSAAGKADLKKQLDKALEEGDVASMIRIRNQMKGIV